MNIAPRIIFGKQKAMKAASSACQRELKYVPSPPSLLAVCSIHREFGRNFWTELNSENYRFYSELRSFLRLMLQTKQKIEFGQKTTFSERKQSVLIIIIILLLHEIINHIWSSKSGGKIAAFDWLILSQCSLWLVNSLSNWPAQFWRFSVVVLLARHKFTKSRDGKSLWFCIRFHPLFARRFRSILFQRMCILS